jgi:hypothetical protein
MSSTCMGNIHVHVFLLPVHVYTTDIVQRCLKKYLAKIKNKFVSPYFFDNKDVLGNAKISIFWQNESKIRNFQQNKFWAKRKERKKVTANFQ